jgi:hypothetical protein
MENIDMNKEEENKKKEKDKMNISSATNTNNNNKVQHNNIKSKVSEELNASSNFSFNFFVNNLEYIMLLTLRLSLIKKFIMLLINL